MLHLLAKGVAADPTALPASAALRMATINGARALGIDDRIGSLEAGKNADVVAINMNSIETTPLYDPVSHLVYSCSREQVSDVWIAGKHVTEKPRTDRPGRDQHSSAGSRVESENRL